MRGLDRSRGVWCGGLVLPRSDLRKQPFRLAGRGGIWRMTHFVELAKNGVVILAKNDIVIHPGITESQFSQLAAKSDDVIRGQ